MTTKKADKVYNDFYNDVKKAQDTALEYLREKLVGVDATVTQGFLKDKKVKISSVEQINTMLPINQGIILRIETTDEVPVDFIESFVNISQLEVKEEF